MIIQVWLQVELPDDPSDENTCASGPNNRDMPWWRNRDSFPVEFADDEELGENDCDCYPGLCAHTLAFTFKTLKKRLLNFRIKKSA